MNPHPQVLSREPVEYQPALDLYAETVDEVVNFGTHLLAWLVGGGPVQNTRAVLGFQLRHLLEILDGAGTLLRTSVDEPVGILLRAGFEVSLGIRYITLQDSDRRAAAYRVAEVHRGITGIQRLDPNTEVGRRAYESMTADTSGFRPPSAGLDSSSDAEEGRRLLAHPQIAAIEEEWQRTKRERGGRTPSWFSLFGGPANTESLAKNVGRGAWFELLYRDWSGGAHGLDLFKQMDLSSVNQGRAAIMGLRQPGRLQRLAYVAVTLGVLTFRELMAGFLEDKRADLEAWYSSEIRQPLEVLAGGDLIRVL